jgi:hypothetical protein
VSHASVIYWPSVVGNLATIANLQSVTQSNGATPAGYPLVLNATGGLNQNGRYYYNNMIRKISLTSVNNLSGISFVITGIGSPVGTNGNPLATLSVVSETMAGPNNATVNSVNLYSAIDSIVPMSVIVAPNQVSAGFGPSGITAYTFLNTNSSSPQHWSLQGQLLNVTTMTYTFYASLTKPESVNYQYGNLRSFPVQIPAFPVGTAQTTGNYLVSNVNGLNNNIANIVWANINSTATTVNDSTSFYFTCIQQGIT